MIQFITDSHNQAQFAVLPIADFERVKHLLDAESGDDGLGAFLANLQEVEPDEWEVEALASNSANASTIPQSVINLIVEGMPAVAAWRTYRNMTQSEVASRLNVGQSAYSKMESRGNKLRASSREKLAALFKCDPSNLL